ncbi:MAG: GGDEF domain-containing protein [Mariprofundaceae bacterium]
MKHFEEDPRRVLILGAGTGGTSVLQMLRDEELVKIVGMVDLNPAAEGMLLAEELDIPVFTDIAEAVGVCAPCVAFNLTGNEMVEDVVAEAIGVGGVIGGLEAKLIVRMINQLREAKEQLRHEATHDHLTRAFNRRYIAAQLGKGLAQAIRYDFPYSVVLLDIDHFKKVNDTYGHPAGDAVLKTLVQTLQTHIRDADTLGRWGGEEFIILLPHTGEKESIKATQKWLDYVCAQRIELPDGQKISISFSAGVSSHDPQHNKHPISKCVEAILQQVDLNLYKAKDSGRKTVCGTVK